MKHKPQTLEVISKTLTVLILVSLLFVNPGCQPNAGKSKLSFLHTEGQSIVDETGKPFIIRSVGLGNWLLPEGYMWKFGGNADRPRRIEEVVRELIGEEQAKLFWQSFRANYITEADVARMKELGFNTVRVALNARLFMTETDNPQLVDEGFILLENLVTWCKNQGVYVIIDMHGAPGGQTGQNIDDSPNDLPELFMDVKHQDALVKLWLAIVEKYKDEPTVAGYDLLNEPLPQVTGAADKYKDQLEPLYIRLTNEIRKIDSKHMITIEGYDWSNNWSLFKKPFDDNMFYQFHYYCWSYPTTLYNINQFLAKRDSLDTPIWVGETGEKENTIYFGTTQYFEHNNVGWSFWPWKKMDTENTPYSIKKPANWDLIAEYTRGSRKPSTDTAQVALSELLENIKLANCVYFEDVTNAIFRRIPLKIEAENYLHGKYGDTWMVSDTMQTSKYYRTSEFVPVEVISLDTARHKRHWNTEQYIVLKNGEWVKYQVNVSKTRDYSVQLKMDNIENRGSVIMTINGHEFIAKADSSEWEQIDLGKIKLNAGQLNITVKAKDGDIKLDWILVE